MLLRDLEPGFLNQNLLIWYMKRLTPQWVCSYITIFLLLIRYTIHQKWDSLTKATFAHLLTTSEEKKKVYMSSFYWLHLLTDWTYTRIKKSVSKFLNFFDTFKPRTHFWIHTVNLINLDLTWVFRLDPFCVCQMNLYHTYINLWSIFINWTQIRVKKYPI